jgi:hypothetical protein
MTAHAGWQCNQTKEHTQSKAQLGTKQKDLQLLSQYTAACSQPGLTSSFWPFHSLLHPLNNVAAAAALAAAAWFCVVADQQRRHLWAQGRPYGL